MSRKRPYELPEAIARVQETAAELRTNHFTWIVDAAIKHYEKAVERHEIGMIRHDRFKDEPHHAIVADQSRSSEFADHRRFLEQDRDILAFLIALHDLLALQAAEEFAREFRSSFGDLFGKLKKAVKR